MKHLNLFLHKSLNLTLYNKSFYNILMPKHLQCYILTNEKWQKLLQLIRKLHGLAVKALVRHRSRDCVSNPHVVNLTKQLL